MNEERTLADLIDEKLNHYDLLVGVLALVAIKQRYTAKLSCFDLIGDIRAAHISFSR